MSKPRKGSDGGVQGEVGGNAAYYRQGPSAQDDPLRNPVGIYSGISKRNAIRDGEFVTVENMPREGKEAPLRRRKG